MRLDCILNCEPFALSKLSSLYKRRVGELLDEVVRSGIMKTRQLKQHSLSYILSVFMGVLLLLTVVVGFLRFAKGNVLIAMALAFLSTFVLSLFLGWVEVVEVEEEIEVNRKRKRGKL